MKCEHLDDDRITQSWEYIDQEGFFIDGCCGGGCCVLQGLTHCPFCGLDLIKAKWKTYELKKEREGSSERVD